MAPDHLKDQINTSTNCIRRSIKAYQGDVIKEEYKLSLKYSTPLELSQRIQTIKQDCEVMEEEIMKRHHKNKGYFLQEEKRHSLVE